MTRDMNVLDRFASVTSRTDQSNLAVAAQRLTRQGLQDGFEIEDIIACLSYMVEAEAEVVKDVFDNE